MGTTRSFDLAGIRCTFAQDTARDCAASPRAPLVDSAHHLSDALQAEQAEITHFQETTQRLKCQMHELLRACEGYLSTCQAIDTSGLAHEAERLGVIASCPYAPRPPSSST
jgi:hypothetical protein